MPILEMVGTEGKGLLNSLGVDNPLALIESEWILLNCDDAGNNVSPSGK